MNLTRRPTLEFTAGQIADAINASFEDYLLPVQFTPQAAERRFRAEHLDPEASMIYAIGDRVVGVLMVARRGWNARIAAMGITKAHRGQGIGKRIMQEAIGDAKERGDRRLCLEVFEQNPNAVKLYASVGFRVARRLVGYRREAEPGNAEHLLEIDPLEFSRIAATEGAPDLPWQLQPETFAAQVAPVRAYALKGAAFALIRDTPGGAFTLHAILVRREARGQGYGRRTIRGLSAMLGGKACTVPQIVPDDLSPEFFSRLEFAVVPLNQFEMRLEL